MTEVPEHPFFIVGLGASAGGLNALVELLGAVPARSGLALVVIQHLDPHHESKLAEVLRTRAPMAVVNAAHGAKVEPDHVYVIQPGTNVAIADGVLSVTPRPDDRRPHYPIDFFLRSLATVQGPYAAAVILSGTGSDGTLGTVDIKAAGGVTFAQDERSAQYPDMPRNAVASGAVDLTLPPAEIGARLATLAQHPYLASVVTDAPDASAADPGDFHRIIAAIQANSGADFSQYRDSTLKRRTARRMLLRGFSSVRDYAQFLEQNREEAEALFRDVLINVTSFFRDPEMFEELKRQVFPAILANGREHAPVRLWIPGCSTGQEAYSIGIALLEFLESTGTNRAIQIFATDLGDPAALDRARAGVYPESIEAEVSPERLRRFFTKDDRHYRIRKEIRDLCVFARQNVTTDPPFSRVDLVSCRNVMIYMSARLQERVLPVFHFALNPGGFLILGLAETTGPYDDLFEVVDRKYKIYRRKDARSRPLLRFIPDGWSTDAVARRPGVAGQPAAEFQREADRLVQAHYAPPGVLIDQDDEVQQFRGRTSPYLEAPPGLPTTNILRMVKDALFTDMRAALSEARATGAPVVREHLHTRDGDADVEFTLRVLPVVVPTGPEMHLLVLFESRDWPAWSAGSAGYDDSAAAGRDTAWLRQELAASKQYLQSIVEQQESASQDLRAAHEEVLSSNEELQSTNEELETTKEELQSANEELTTVNEQFLRRNRELDALTDDLSNFISSAALPMVTVGRDLRIRRLTPAAQRAFNLLPTDVGRSLEHIRSPLAIDGLRDVVERVVASVQPWEREVTDSDGRWWVVRVLPFRTADDRIDGATVVAVDIDLIHRGHELLEARDDAVAIVQAVREPLVVLDGECRVVRANDAFSTLLGEDSVDIEGRPLWEIGQGIWSDGDFRRALDGACAGTVPLVDLEVERVLHGRGRRSLVLNTSKVERPDRPPLLLLAIEDVTDTRLAEALRVDAETLRLVDRRKDEFLGILAHELRNPLAPMRFALELLRLAKGDPSEAERARQVLERQVAHMVRIVDDLLDVSRITQGKIELRKEVVDLSHLVEAAIEFCRPSIEAAQHTLTVSLPDEVVRLRADSVRLTQVLVNLVNNAVKFTPPGGHIWLIADTVADGLGDPDQMRIRVRDSGVGISEELLPTIFDIFMQGDQSLERSHGGLGIGLTLVRNLVALHGGTIEAHSHGAGTGSEFTVRLPLASPQADPPADTGEEDRRATGPLRILVADDSADSREMLGYLLKAEGHTVALATDGPAAITVAAAFRPDVVVLDIGMPGANGYEVAEALRRGAENSSVALVALSGLGQQGDKERAAQAGFDRHFTKPMDMTAFWSFLAGLNRVPPSRPS